MKNTFARDARPTFLGLSSAFPKNAYLQKDLHETIGKQMYGNIPQLERIIHRVRVRRRCLALDPREVLVRKVGLGERMAIFEREVMEVGGRSVEEVLRKVDRETLGSFIMASSTGYIAPTPDVLMARRFNLPSTLRRTFVGNMACNAGMNALNIALDSLAARPHERVLLNCTEFSSLHVRPEEASREQVVVHALFGDGSASAVLGMEPPGVGPQVLRFHSMQLYDAAELMTWRLVDEGFRMTLSPLVPSLIGEHIDSLIGAITAPEGLSASDIKHWAIHPGGPKIVEVIGQKYGLSDLQLRSTWHVLGEYGNCASPTVYIVLQDLIAQDKPQPGEYGVMLVQPSCRGEQRLGRGLADLFRRYEHLDVERLEDPLDRSRADHVPVVSRRDSHQLEPALLEHRLGVGVLERRVVHDELRAGRSADVLGELDGRVHEMGVPMPGRDDPEPAVNHPGSGVELEGDEPGVLRPVPEAEAIDGLSRGFLTLEDDLLEPEGLVEVAALGADHDVRVPGSQPIDDGRELFPGEGTEGVPVGDGHARGECLQGGPVGGRWGCHGLDFHTGRGT
jgi:predicted naringenin-chalcone synthase